MTDQRSKYIDRLLWQLKDITNASFVKKHFPAAIERFEYLCQHGVMVIARKDEQTGQVLFEDTAVVSLKNNMDEPLSILPIFKEDASLDPLMEYIVQHSRFASYGPSNNFIAVHVDAQETERFMAACLLHEVGHAQAAQKEGRAFKPPQERNIQDRLEEELKLWLFDCKLARSIGGEKFEREIDKTVSHLRRNFSAPASMVQHPNPGVGWPLDFCYGRLKNQEAFLVANRDATYLLYCKIVFARRYLEQATAHRYQLSAVEIFQGDSYQRQQVKLDIFRKSQSLGQG